MWEEFLQLRFVCGKSFNICASIYIPGSRSMYMYKEKKNLSLKVGIEGIKIPCF